MTLYYPPIQNALQKTLDADLNQGATASATLNNTTGLQNKPGVMLIDRIDANNTVKNASDWEWVIYTGVSGSTVTGLTRGVGGSSDQDHIVGAVVEFVIDVNFAQSILNLLDGTDAGIKVKTAIYDTNGNEVIKVPPTTSAVNEITVTNSATGGDVEISATGGDDNISLKLTPKGTGKIKISPKIVTTTDDATAVINCDITDQYQLTAVANATEFTVTGTPTAGQKLIIRIKDAGVSKNLTFTGFTAIGTTIPTATTAGKTTYVGCIYNATASTWDVVAVTTEV